MRAGFPDVPRLLYTSELSGRRTRQQRRVRAVAEKFDRLGCHTGQAIASAWIRTWKLFLRSVWESDSRGRIGVGTVIGSLDKRNLGKWLV